MGKKGSEKDRVGKEETGKGFSVKVLGNEVAGNMGKEGEVGDGEEVSMEAGMRDGGSLNLIHGRRRGSVVGEGDRGRVKLVVARLRRHFILDLGHLIQLNDRGEGGVRQAKGGAYGGGGGGGRGHGGGRGGEEGREMNIAPGLEPRDQEYVAPSWHEKAFEPLGSALDVPPPYGTWVSYPVGVVEDLDQATGYLAGLMPPLVFEKAEILRRGSRASGLDMTEDSTMGFSLSVDDICPVRDGEGDSMGRGFLPAVVTFGMGRGVKGREGRGWEGRGLSRTTKQRTEREGEEKEEVDGSGKWKRNLVELKPEL
ncbi:hypothetical protein BJ684DRAFT_17898 [Piptocephalis cylindrospora]|uniref:Uncharacterized protein n=1 Tax=Piptocephalis cylindrospora TaxID=1907219 RepID=A0A4P9XYJ7_9FUNG|nr:hypothetical protein BJ684DRAFT_17898 [Piptocephalis cylindrospora]|eukprot:RKP11518.1 hypothetical protein BJ684DRAFT_17898 [Piptocephalis cylindrospora]